MVDGLLASGDIAEADILRGTLRSQGLELSEEAFAYSSSACNCQTLVNVSTYTGMKEFLVVASDVPITAMKTLLAEAIVTASA